ncbi:MAG: TetR/AcrR family transcriptional regulator [Bradymonadia bacterium]
MGRPKQYDREDLLKRAVGVFHRKGYDAAKTEELVEALGVNRKSMYAEFGSKQALYEAALEYYDRNQLSRVLSGLEAPDGGAEAIHNAFEGYGRASEGPMSGLGCLLCNAAVERGPLDEGVKRHVNAYFERLNAAFRHALGNAQRDGEVGEGADLDELAAYFTMALIGVAALVRAKASPTQVKAACRVATRAIGQPQS